MGCILVLQIEHIDLKFNFRVFLFFAFSLPRAGGQEGEDRKKGWYPHHSGEKQ
jgi:hypothetical protein